ncbi:MAG: zinc ribbon domain-containing protein [Candidatus Jordarchaeaceae archaeon]
MRRTRFRRYLMFRLPWVIMRRTFVILFFGALAYKLHRDDLSRVEKEARKPAKDLTEEELKAAMKKLGIQKIELTEEDNEAISSFESEKGPFCTYCGAKVYPKAVYCYKCGNQIESKE